MMMVFQDAVDATFAAFGVDAVYVPAGGDPVSVRVIARRPDTIVGFGETRIHAETATFELRASEVANPRPMISSSSMARRSSSRASRSGLIQTGSCGRWMPGPREWVLMPLLATQLTWESPLSSLPGPGPDLERRCVSAICSGSA
jgi:hypothetical protein